MSPETPQFGGPELIAHVTQSFYKGMSRVEFDSIKNELIAPGFTVGDLIQAEFDFEVIKWQREKIVHNLNGMRLNFDEKTESRLREKARDMKISPKDLVMIYIKEGLKG